MTTVDFEWIRQLQMEINSQKKIILYAEQDSISGILGFYNCLRKEIPNNKIRFVTVYHIEYNVWNGNEDHKNSSVAASAALTTISFLKV